MPHKRNPIGSENITGISRVIRGYINGYENVPLWHERDIFTLQLNVSCYQMLRFRLCRFTINC